MGFLRLFLTDQFQRDYNCSFYSVDQIPAEKRMHFTSGIILLIIGIIFELLYIPCVYALSKKHVRQASFCFEIMLLMCLYDMLTLPITSSLTAYMYITGGMYCSHPKFIIVAGQLLHGLWIGYAHVSVILAINRCMVFSPYNEFLFEGKKRYIWLIYPIILSVGILLFASPGAYNGVYGAWFFDPHLSYYTDKIGKYNSPFQFWNNVMFCTVIPMIYIVFAIQYRIMSRNRTVKMPKKEYALFIQTMIVNSTIVSSAFVYSLMQYIRLPVELVSLSHLAWVVVEGSPSVLYLFFNRTIKKVLFKEMPLIRIFRKKITNKPTGLTSKTGRSSGVL